MIDIVNYNVHCNDEHRITAIEIKMKSHPEEQINENNQHMIARISAAFNSLSIFSKHGKNFKMDLNPKRHNVANLHVSFWENEMSFKDIGEFLDSFQQTLANTPF